MAYHLNASSGRRLSQFRQALRGRCCHCRRSRNLCSKANHLQRRLRITEFVLWPNIGGMSAEHAHATMELTIRAVAPRVNVAVGD